MFEKEANDNKPPYAYCSFNTNCELWKDGFQKGAEFTYNKVNEWHYVKGGDLPKTKKRVLVLLKDVEEPILDYYRQDGLWNYALENEVLAWKEIVLPELKESE